MKNIMPPINTPDNAFHDGNPATGEQGTIVPGLWLNNSQDATRNIQQELISVLTETGIEIDENVNNQLLLAIQKLISDKTPAASLLAKGIVQLNSSTTSASETLAATPKAVKTVSDAAAKIVSDLSANGIGLSSQPTIENFDFQTFVFTSGANYIVSSSSWINVPSEISYPTGLIISIKADYVAAGQIGLEIKPSTVSSANFRVWYLRMGGDPRSRTFTAREIRTSANPVPITGGGTGAITASAALANFGLSDVAHIPFVQTMGARMVSFLTAGTFTFTVPDGVTRIRARVVGGGGGAGGSGAGRTGGGGGGGGYAESWITVTPGQVLTIIVGSAGNGGGVSGAGSNGGASSVSGFLSASGGGGGAGGGVGTGGGGIGGVGTGGQFNTTGSDGVDGTNHSDTSGAAGAAGCGGGSVLGGMTRSGTGSLNATGIGSGGSCSYLYIAATGGNGHDGAVILEY
ncbi:phage tail protein [Yersinia intermedia]|uniref:phage tail protein n=1 Tax=Yersinia intermedia TaxID=631 RepID=UPI0025AB01EA|nr:phage tail protein [Yersinia intermedia]MDN0114354.1 phage tail protein [Yersinia intermedia]